MRTNRSIGFSRRRLPLLGVLGAIALAAVITIVLTSLVDRAPPEAARTAAGERTDPACVGGAADHYACHRERYRRLVREFGIRDAFAELKAEYGRNSLVRGTCHQLVHDIGRAAAQRFRSVRAAYSNGEDFCGAGYYHGVIEVLVTRIGAKKMRADINTICAPLGAHQARSRERLECAHGLGHGLMAVLSGAVFDALQTCDALTNPWDQRRCYGGVFMQNSMTAARTHHHRNKSAKYFSPDRPLHLCTRVRARYRASCYHFQTMYALHARENDFGEAFELCTEVGHGFRPSCYQGLGRAAIVRAHVQFRAVRAQTRYPSMLCMMGRDYEARSNCILGAIRGLTTHHSDDKQALTLCRFLSGDLYALCVQRVTAGRRSL